MLAAVRLVDSARHHLPIWEPLPCLVLLRCCPDRCFAFCAHLDRSFDTVCRRHAVMTFCAGMFGSPGAPAAAAPKLLLPPYERPPYTTSSVLHRVGLRTLHDHPALRSGRRMLPAEGLARKLCHHQTTRGHQFAVYCVSFDKSGRYLATGSDDMYVKVRHTAALVLDLRLGHLIRGCWLHDGDQCGMAVSMLGLGRFQGAGGGGILPKGTVDRAPVRGRGAARHAVFSL